ncbi:hypothetical protein V9T40_001552 [Parthenolecanium corni]|uniref:Uncharacterized protein n=1 Tax=Parthenolecanium corni TaxID=536013 RepID=A0AAN9TWD4_9HEMI
MNYCTVRCLNYTQHDGSQSDTLKFSTIKISSLSPQKNLMPLTNLLTNSLKIGKLILDILMDLKDLSDDELADEIMTLMFSEEVYEELITVFGQKDKLDVSNLLKLTLLEKCLKETMRKYSIAPAIMRQAITDMTLCGYKYAMMSLKVFLSHILRNFKLSTQQTKVELGVNVVLKCRNGYHIKFEPR